MYLKKLLDTDFNCRTTKNEENYILINIVNN